MPIKHHNGAIERGMNCFGLRGLNFERAYCCLSTDC